VKESGQERCLWLEEEEAMGLLDIVMLSPAELSPEQRAAVLKLSEFCRKFLREEEPVTAGSGKSVPLKGVLPSLYVA
jgi:hypothetical protein